MNIGSGREAGDPEPARHSSEVPASETWGWDRMRPTERRFATLFALSLAGSALFAAIVSVRWPLVGDASLIHYIAFLIGRGWAPYRQLGDMNMPGAFLVELAAMHLFGPGALAWRLFDFTLGGVAAGAFFSIAGRTGRFAALFASCLFFLVHTRDGLAQGGQRDLTMAVALLAATALLLGAARRGSLAQSLAFGLLSGVAATIKPTAVLLTIAQVLVVFFPRRRTGRRGSAAAVAAVGWLVAPALSLAFLLRENALGAFLHGLHTVVPYYASLGHRPVSYILSHSVSPVVALVVLWIATIGLEPKRYLVLARSPERLCLLAGVAFGFLNCILQQRALPYYRYPLLAFLLPLIALDLTEAARPESHGGLLKRTPGPTRRGQTTGIVAATGLALGSLFLAPQSAILIHRYRPQQTEMLTSLEANLESLGGRSLSGRIQCIDSVSGCNTALYRMRVEPATGVLSDFLLFGNTTDRQRPDAIPVIRETRAQFATAMLARPPEVIVVTSHLHMSGPENFGKLERWPAFADLLASRYSLDAEWSPSAPERWWSREEFPASYRIYRLHHAP